MTYGLLSDLHNHDWSIYSTTNPDGVNSRLRLTLDEMVRAAKELLKAGGRTLVIAGDIFHVRGSLDPEVLNPVQETFRRIMDLGVEILAIPGNHDLKGKETTELGSAIQTLAETFSAEGSIQVFNAPQLVFGPHPMAFIPWASTTAALIKQAEGLAHQAANDLKDFDLIIHAGIDGVLSGMPDHGLTAKILAGLGFKRVLAGHYHNHKDLGDGVFSIGATTHQTWSDIGSRAGFLLVDDTDVHFNDTMAPKFIDITGMTEDDIELTAPDNYVRFRGGAMKEDEIKELRQFLAGTGAKGISIQVTKQNTVARSAAPKSGTTLEKSVADFVDGSKDIPANLDRNAIKLECADILSTVKMVVEES